MVSKNRKTRSKQCVPLSLKGVDAIFIAPVVATGWEPVLKEAKEAKIPVFLPRPFH